MSEIRDIKLAPKGEMKIEWVESHMPVLAALRKQFEADKPFAGLKVTLSIHLEAKTAYLCRVLEAGGAIMSVTGSNPLSTQDDVVAALAAGGMDVYAWYGATDDEYERHIAKALENSPDVVMDDGADLSDADLQRSGFVVRGLKAQPHRLALEHRQEDAALSAPVFGDPVGDRCKIRASPNQKDGGEEPGQPGEGN